VRLRRLISREDGATAVEYGIMLAFIAAVIVAAVTLLGGDVTGIFQDMVDRWP
jgi:pilus assembly protein Flp/PilA